MATSRGGGRGGRPRGPKVGTIVTGMIVGQAKRGVMVELGAAELLLASSRFGAAADRIEASGYGDPLTVEVVADPTHPGRTGLDRVGIERSLRQPRPIDAVLARRGSGFALVPVDGSPAFEAFVLDRADPDVLDGTSGRWLVGAAHRDRRFVLLEADATAVGYLA